MYKHIKVVILREELQHLTEVVFVKLLFITVRKIILYILEFHFIVLTLLIVVFFQYAESLIHATGFSILYDVNHISSTNILTIAVFHTLYVLTSIWSYDAIQVICYIYHHRPVILDLTSACLYHLRQKINNLHGIKCQMQSAKDSEIIDEDGSREFILVNQQSADVICKQGRLLLQQWQWNDIHLLVHTLAFAQWLGYVENTCSIYIKFLLRINLTRRFIPTLTQIFY